MSDAVVGSVAEAVTPFDAFRHDFTRVHASGHSAYQKYLIAENPAFGRFLVLDDVVQSTEADEFIYHEGIVHPAMLAVGSPRRVLILGGGEGATAREVLRWPSVERVDMIDIDAEVVAACRLHLPRHHAGAFDDPRLHVQHIDAVEFLGRIRTARELYDVVISDLSDPVDDGPAVFCLTREFFSAISEVVTGRMGWLTAAGLEGRLEPPPYLARAVAGRADIYTQEHPPQTGQSAGWER